MLAFSPFSGRAVVRSRGGATILKQKLDGFVGCLVMLLLPALVSARRESMFPRTGEVRTLVLHGPTCCSTLAYCNRLGVPPGRKQVPP